jgi:signal peptidase I
VVRSIFKGVAWLVGIVAVVALILYATVFDVWVVPNDDPRFTASILPTLAPGDVLLVTRHGSAPSFESLEKCGDPDAPGRFVIGRVAGIAAQKIDIASDAMRVDAHNISIGGTGCESHDVAVENPVSHELTTLSCMRTDSGGLSHGMLRGSDGYDSDFAATVDANRIFLVSDDIHFHQDSRDYGQIDPATCQHVVFRLVGSGGISDGSRRFALLW